MSIIRSRFSFVCSLIILLVLNNISCTREKDKLFTSLSPKRTGIDFKNIIHESEEFNILDYGYLFNGAGVGIGDINNDGLPDIYFCGNFIQSKLYLNKGNFRFEDITTKSRATGGGRWNNGVSMADINGDGWIDIYIACSTDSRPQQRKNLLYINNGDLTFTESASAWGIDDPSYSTHSAFFDYDKDGDLDLFVINHSLEEYAHTDSAQKRMHDPNLEHNLYKNTGNKFVNANKEAGMRTNIMNFGLGLAIADFNNDKWPDIYICNDYSEQDYFYINQQDGTFREELENYFDHISLSSMGNDAGDINNDGFIDMFTLDMDPEDNYENKLVAGPDNYDKYSILKKTGFYNQTTRNMLHINYGGRYFTDIGQYANIFATNWSWSPLLCDLDNDGFKDLYISNGYGRNSTHMDAIMFSVEQMVKQRKGEPFLSKYGVTQNIPATILKNYIFRNNGDYTFSNVTELWGDEHPCLANGTAYADLDNDGDLDLVTNVINGYAGVYRNNSEKLFANNYLKIRLQGMGLNKEGIGARVEIRYGDKMQVQEFQPSRGYMSSMNHELIFGTGKTEIIDEMRIIWPDLLEQRLTNIKTGQTILLKNREAEPVTEKVAEIPVPLLKRTEERRYIDFTHIENEYVDFRKQILLPHFLSTLGPRIAKGDINHDGLEDLYFCGAKGMSGIIYIQNRNGSFKAVNQSCFENDKNSEDTDAAFFDADGDSDNDLYVVSGGNEFLPGSPDLQDRLYLNNGNGVFSRSSDRMPVMITSGSCVKVSDIDNDGDDDLFIGGRVIPENYPLSPRSYILANNGKGYFTDVTEKMNKLLLKPGMVSDAAWTDFNSDGKTDLIIAGEWMKIRIFINSGNALEEITDNCGLSQSEGWWNSIYTADFDKDGDTDIIAGNMGLNTRIKVSADEPATIYAKDFDNNGTMDAIMCYYILGVSYPFYSKDDLQTQLPFIKKKYPDYKSYSDQTINDIFTAGELGDALTLKTKLFESCYIENLGNGQFKINPLPREAQYFPVYAIESGDFNDDGNKDLILGGNFTGTRIKFGEQDTGKGLLLTGNGKGEFTSINDLESGLFIKGEIRDIKDIKLPDGNNLIVFALNNDHTITYTKNKRLK
ncbi:MAG TPA: VCBS repeat-containing protein [Bacteroidales bacterium]|nr:VCBS repeat-containing protein [Bacteroidales bacterium]